MDFVSNIYDKEYEEFLKARLGKIGGSDLAILLGYSQYKTPHQLWQEKTKRVSIDMNTAEKARWGNILEPVIAKETSDRTGLKLINYKKAFVAKNNERMIANIDRAIVDQKDGNGPGLLEIKTVDQWVYKADDWEEGIPINYWLQVQFYFYVTGFKWGKLAILVGGNQLFIEDIAPDYELLGKIIPVVEEWIQQHLIEDKAPSKKAVDWSLTTSDPDKAVEAEEETFDKAYEMAQVKAQIKALKSQEDELKARLIEEMEEAEVMTYGERFVATHKTQITNRFNQTKFKTNYPELFDKFVDKTTSRRFLLKIKGE